MRKNHIRAALLGGIALFAIGGTSAMAQDAQSEAKAGAADEGEIVVTGVRASLQSAALQKKNAANVIDSITAEDIGKFPTENVADASQRITGVQITRTRGSGTAASIRGLPTDFTRVELNGSTLASSIVDLRGGGTGGDISRSFDFRLLPTEFVQTLEVVKSPTAELQEGGLSGTINVKTVRPLDIGKTMLAGSAFGVWQSNADKITPKVSGLFSTTLADDRIGFLVAGGYDENRTETHSVWNTGWARTTEGAIGQDVNGDGDQTDFVNIPGQVRTEIAREHQRRLVLTSILEAKPTDSLKLYVEGFYSRFHDQVQSFENLNIFTGARGKVYDPSTTETDAITGIDPAQTISQGLFATQLGLRQNDTRANDRVNDSVAQTYYGKVGAEFNQGPWKAGATFTYSKSRQVGDNLNLAQIQRFDTTYSCQPGQQICGISFSPASQAAYLDPTQGIIASLNGAFGRRISDRVSEFKLNASREFDGSFLRRIAIGGAYTNRHAFADGTVLVVTAAQLAALDPSIPAKTGGFGLGPYYQIVGSSRGAFLGAYSGSQPFPSTWLASDTLALLGAIPRSTLAAVPGAVQPNLASVVNVHEKIWAGYVQADFASADDRLSGNIGVRVVRTTETAQGVSPDLNGLIIQVETGGTVTVPPAGNVATSNSYTYALPSANLKYQITPDLLVRVAASRTLSRPTLTQLSPSTTVAQSGGTYTITSGNPGLKPFLSTNYDAGIEWYPNPDTALTFAGFIKSLSSLVFPTTDQITLPVTFYYGSTNSNVVQNQLFQRTRPDNGSGVTVKGFEIGYQQAFTFLPGLLKHTGTQINYTFISNNKPQVLTAASKNNFNVSAYYDDGKLAVRGSYTWRDKFVSFGLPGGYNGLGQTTLPRGELDVNISYNVTPEISVVFQGVNVLDNVDMNRSTLGGLPVDFYDTGHQYMVGTHFKF